MHADPLVAGPILGWRLWFIPEGEFILRSLQVHQSPWIPRQAYQAVCSRQKGFFLRKKPLHSLDEIPHLDCACGIYALPNAMAIYRYYQDEWLYYLQMKYKERCRHQLVERYGTSRPKTVIGQVSLWGKVNETGQIVQRKVSGYRAQMAYPKRVFVAKEIWDDQTEVLSDALSRSYQIETTILNEVSDLLWIDGNSKDRDQLPIN